MKENLNIVSAAPHIYTKENVNFLMYGVVIAMLPLLASSVYFFGLDALRVIIYSVIFCILFEYLIQKFMLKKKTSIQDGSALVTGLLLAFNLPSNLPLWIIIIGALVSIGIAKMSFGGLGNNPFNPALVSRAFLLISFPVQMTTWPKPLQPDRFIAIDGITGATALSIVKEGVNAGKSIKALENTIPSSLDFFYGATGGSLGEVSALAILLGLLYMLIRKIISWHIPVSMLGTAFIMSLLFWLADPVHYASPLFHLLTGGILLGAVFMATDMVTSPMTPLGMIIFGSGIGVLTMLIRYFGAYPEGVSFAILIMNAFVPLLNKYIKPRRFGA